MSEKNAMGFTFCTLVGLAEADLSFDGAHWARGVSVCDCGWSIEEHPEPRRDLVVRFPQWLIPWLTGELDHRPGISSRTIAFTMIRAPQLLDRKDAPYDAGDVGRCVQLLDLAERSGADWRSRMDKVAEICPAWAPLVPRWPEIEEAWREDLAAERQAKAERWLRKDGKRRRSPKPFDGAPLRSYWLVKTLRGLADPYEHIVPHPFLDSSPKVGL